MFVFNSVHFPFLSVYKNDSKLAPNYKSALENLKKIFFIAFWALKTKQKQTQKHLFWRST